MLIINPLRRYGPATVALALALFVVAHPAYGAADCGPHLGEVPLGVSVSPTYDAFGRLARLDFEDRARPELTASAVLYERQVTFDMHLGNSEGHPRALFGRDVCRIALHEFGPAVMTVRAVWLDGVNLETNRRLVADGVAPARAAAATWTGRMALRHGFTRVEKVYAGEDPALPNYVRYNFERP
jgi:hypothetical protein